MEKFSPFKNLKQTEKKTLTGTTRQQIYNLNMKGMRSTMDFTPAVN